MCERFAQVWDEELEWYVARWVGPRDHGLQGLLGRDPSRDSRLLPRDPVGVLLQRPGGPALEWVRWGFPSGPRQVAINTPLEEALRPGPWRPLMERRAVVPMTGFYEWGAHDGRPYFFRRRDGNPLMVAAVSGLHEDGEGAMPCASLLTAPAPPDVAHVRGQLPLVLEEAEVAAWLDPGCAPDEAAARASPPAEGVLRGTLVTREADGMRSREPRRVP